MEPSFQESEIFKVQEMKNELNTKTVSVSTDPAAGMEGRSVCGMTRPVKKP